MPFDSLHPSIRQVLEARGFGSPSAAQEAAIPVILGGENTLLIAPTGMGKTEAAILPLFHDLLNREHRPITVLYITPLRALNRDMLKRLREWAADLDIRIDVRHGDTSQAQRRKQALDPPDILITTPETFQLLFLGSRLREAVTGVRYVVIDEIHELASDERGAQLSLAMERLEEVSPGFQRIGLSATVSNPEEVGRFLAGGEREGSPAGEQEAVTWKPRPFRTVVVKWPRERDLRVEIPEVSKNDDELGQDLMCNPQVAAAMREMVDLMKGSRSTLVFVNTREAAEALSMRLGLMGIEGIGIHHGSLSKSIRVAMEEDFKAGRLRALICTSSLELGIDVGSTDLVIQYNSPRQATRLLQRAGRSGHTIDGTSRGVTVATSTEQAMEALAITELASAETVEEVRVRERPLSVLANQLSAMTLVRTYGIEEAFDLATGAYPFRSLTMRELRMVLQQLDNDGLIQHDEKSFWRRGKGRYYFYENISMIPDERTYPVRDIVTRRIIGTLDEAFVISYIEPGGTFVMKGAGWRVVEVADNGEITVEPHLGVAAIPSWIGEDIPVPFIVAQKVGDMRERLWEEKYGKDEDGDDSKDPGKENER